MNDKIFEEIKDKIISDGTYTVIDNMPHYPLYSLHKMLDKALKIAYETGRNRLEQLSIESEEGEKDSEEGEKEFEVKIEDETRDS